MTPAEKTKGNEQTLSDNVDDIVTNVINANFDNAMAMIAMLSSTTAVYIVATAYQKIREIDQTSASMFMTRLKQRALGKY